MLSYFSVDKIFFTILNYPMSYIELVGTILYLWSVWLIAKQKILTWPIGILSVILYMILFYQIQLYSDTIEQIYYLGASVYGWWFWNKQKDISDHPAVGFSDRKMIMVWVITTVLISILFGFFISQIHLIFPAVIQQPASFPYIDALTTIMSFAAMWLMARKKTESWIYWIIVDVIGIWLYFIKDVKLLSLLYVVLLFMAVKGFNLWSKNDQR